MSISTPCPCGSEKPFATCHGAKDPTPLVVVEPVLHSDVPAVKLDLAAGQNCREGFESVDLPGTGAKHEVDLLRYPWPFADSSVDELHCSHFIEHIPMTHVLDDGTPTGGTDSRDAFFRFFDECFRVLRPGGIMTVVCPVARSNRAFQDPTHRRFIVAETFFYLSAEWRKAQRLDHYKVVCDFKGDVGHSYPSEFNAYVPEVQQRKFLHEWNTLLDWHAKLTSLKASR